MWKLKSRLRTLLKGIKPWIDLEIVILNKVSQTEKDKYCTVSLTCGIQKKATNELTYKTNRITYVENKLKVTRK